MSLHYLVKLEMLIARMLQLSCYRKKLHNLSHFNRGLQICHIWIQLITACGKYCKRSCTKHASLLWSCQRHFRSDDMAQLGPLRSQLLFQFVQISDAYFVNYFAANLLRKWCTKFQWNCPSFIEDITKKPLVWQYNTHKTFMRIIINEFHRDASLTKASGPLRSCKENSCYVLTEQSTFIYTWCSIYIKGMLVNLNHTKIQDFQEVRELWLV